MSTYNDRSVLEELALLAGIPTDMDAVRPSRAELAELKAWMKRLHQPSWRALLAAVQAQYDQNRIQRHALVAGWMGEAAPLALPRFDASHDSEHVMRVVSTALLIALREMKSTGEKIDLDVVAIAALGHDLVSSVKTDEMKQFDTQRSVELLRVLPQRADITWERLFVGRSARRVKDIVVLAEEIILGCSATHGDTPTHGAERAVRDADLLECIGIIGLLRFASSSDDLPRRLVRTLGAIPEKDVDLQGWDYSVDATIKRGLGYVSRLSTAPGRQIAAARLPSIIQALAALQRELDPLANVANVIGFKSRSLRVQK